MSMTDPIADFLTRIRNASRAKHSYVDVPESRTKREIAKVLMNSKYIRKYIRIRDGKQGFLRIYLSYTSDGKSVIEDIQRVSKPGRRIYYGVKEIPRVLNGLGVMILTTPSGVISDHQARKMNVGGEPLAIVW